MIETLTTDKKTVDHLIQDLEDGVITEQERTQLMELMRNNASVRNLYIKHIEMVALLQQSAQSRSELGTMPVSQSMIAQERRRGGIASLTYGIAALLINPLITP